MSNKLTFFVANSTGSSIRKMVVAKPLLISFFTVLTLYFICMGAILFDYYHLKRASLEGKTLKNTLLSQQDEIANQRKQIQLFAAEINALKSKLLDLNSFEKKIRIIANIEKSVDQDGVFGVGGSIPENLDLQVTLTQKHNSLLREMHEQVGQLNQLTDKQEEGFASLLKYLEDQRNLLACTPAISPTKGWITSKFGYRKSPFTGIREFHKGLDIATRKGTKVVATADGIVTFVGKKGFLGNALIIDHGHGIVTRYAHLSKSLVKRGTVVKRGDAIAEVGNTGRSTGPHLHYDVRLNGIAVNPEKYILN